MGWQSGAAAVGPTMALLSCQLPKDASLSSNSPSPCMPKGKAWSFYLLTVCIGQARRYSQDTSASRNLLKNVFIERNQYHLHQTPQVPGQVE